MHYVLRMCDGTGVCCIICLQCHMWAQIKPCLGVLGLERHTVTKVYQLCFLSAQFGCSYTRGNNTYLLCLTVLMETHQRSWKIDRNRERGGKQAWDALLLYCCTLYCPCCFSRRWQWALTHISFLLCWRWRPKWIPVCRCCCTMFKSKAPKSPNSASINCTFLSVSGYT